jgi:hypothetical protein
MNDNLNIFEQALDKLAFRQPVPFEARQFALYNKRKALELTLKKFGDYSVYYGLVLRIYFYAIRLGITLSVLQSKIILFAVSAIACGALYSAAYLTANILKKGVAIPNNIHINYSAESGQEIQSERMESHPVEKNDKLKKQPNTIKNRIGVERFSGEAVDEKLLDSLTDNLAEKLISLRGKERVINLRKGIRKKNINLLLSGSIEKLGNQYIITAKIINVENSNVLFITTEETNDAGKIEKIISDFAEKAAETVNIE